MSSWQGLHERGHNYTRRNDERLASISESKIAKFGVGREKGAGIELHGILCNQWMTSVYCDHLPNDYAAVIAGRR